MCLFFNSDSISKKSDKINTFSTFYPTFPKKAVLKNTAYLFLFYNLRNTPQTFPNIMQSGTMIGSIVLFCGCKRM